MRLGVDLNEPLFLHRCRIVEVTEGPHFVLVEVFHRLGKFRVQAAGGRGTNEVAKYTRRTLFSLQAHRKSKVSWLAWGNIRALLSSGRVSGRKILNDLVGGLGILGVCVNPVGQPFWRQRPVCLDAALLEEDEGPDVATFRIYGLKNRHPRIRFGNR
ncbi:hypothetical protein VTN31DRAFT_6749 [Thermomyces dupontii]|uniref:uncharacterized protein n=1 Tax=Talaromyces thermophilus TaxID=28565 RepID=UPI0037442927